MKTYLPIKFTLFLIVVTFCFLPDIAFGQGIKGEKINLTPKMVINESGIGDATLITDEQDIAGDPLYGTYGKPENFWKTSFSATYPLSAFIDLGNIGEITNILIFDTYDVGDLVVEYGEPGNWQYLFTDQLKKYKKWKIHDVDISTRYIRFKKMSPKSIFSEVVIYGNVTSVAIPNITSLTAGNPTINSIELNWYDPPLNFTQGNIYNYDLRYSTSLINDQNFDNAIVYPTGFNPDNSSTLKSVVVKNLESVTKYYFAIKIIGEENTSELSNIASEVTTNGQQQAEHKLLVNPDMVINECGEGEAGRIADEQEISGDPANGQGGNPLTVWKPGSNQSHYPASVYIDLGQINFITRIFIRDIYNIGDLIVEYGIPGDWVYLFTEPLNKYKIWKDYEVNLGTRYIRFTRTSKKSNFSEVVIYGYDAAAIPTEEKLELYPSMVTNISGYGEPTNLFDEQEIAGDPANSPGGNPVTMWTTPFNPSTPYPLYAYVDLGKPFDLTKIFLRDYYDVGIFTVSYGMPGDWEYLFEDNMLGYLSWNQHDVNVNTRYLRFGKNIPNANVAEIVIYGIDSLIFVNDTIPPAPITDLGITEITGNSVTLSWPAPGDDGIEGVVTEYLLRYGSYPITDENFYEMPQYYQVPVPEQSGTIQYVTVDNLISGTPYYFAIKSVDDFQNISELSNVPFCETEIIIGGPPHKIILLPEMVLNEYGHGDATMLVDEQILSGDPEQNQGGNPSNEWIVGSTSWKYPSYAIIDLGSLHYITNVYLYDASDEEADSAGIISLYYGEPFNWDILFVDSLLNSEVWNQHEVNGETRYLRVQIHSPETRMPEILVYGSPLAYPDDPPEPVMHETVTIDRMIGANIFINDPLGKIEALGFAREYHNWMWCEGNTSPTYPGYPDNENEFDASISLGWNFDTFYENLLDLEVEVAPAIQCNVPWLLNPQYNNLAYKPITEGEDPESPASYMEHADHLFQYAARYGNTYVNDSLLKLKDNQPRFSGSGLIKYIESWNEQDNWWKGRDAFFTPYEYAAMASADFDGHKKTLGTTVGIKNADTSLKLVMGGLADPDLNYVRAMKLWGDYFRNGDFPADVINVHHYCNDAEGQPNGTVGVSPEDDHLKQRMQEFVDYRNKYLPGKEVWITEFGYDTHPESPQRAPEIATYGQEEVQAQWLIRSYLALAAACVDRAAMYMLRDVDPNNPTKFCTSGLCSSRDSNYVAKKSWYYIYTMKNRLKGMRFEQEIESGNQNVLIYKFKHTDENVSAYAVWCPTSNGTIVENYELTLDQSEVYAKLIELTNGEIYGAESNLNISDGKISIDVSERPVFVIVTDGNYSFPLIKQEYKFMLDSGMLVNECGMGDPNTLVDEQELSGDVDKCIGGEPLTYWQPSTSYSDYPLSVYIDLGQEYEISKIYLWDRNKTGDFTISTGTPDNWTELFTDKLNKYYKWSGHVVNISTRYIRLTAESYNSRIGEIIIYVRE